jgi:hypothetical protein
VTIIRAMLRKNNPSTTNASFRLHLFQTAPTVANGDNGAFLSNNVLNYVGKIDITMDMLFSDGASGASVLLDPIVTSPWAGGINLFALIEARAPYLPTSGEVFVVSLEVVQD